MLRALEVLSGPQAGQLYQTLFFEQRAKFQYPPTSLLPLELLGRAMPLDLAYLNGLNLGVFLLNAAALAWLAHAVFSAGTGPLRPGLRASWAAAFAFLAGIIFYPVTKALMQGQIQVWLDLGFTLAVLAWWLRRHFTAGLLLGLACAIKPQLGLFLLWGLVWRRWDFVVGFLAAALPVGALSVAFYGLPNHIAYLEVLSFILRHGEAYAPNNSVNGILNRLLLGGPSLPWDEHAFAPYNPYVHAGTILATLGFLLVALAPAVLRTGRGAAPTGIRHRRPLRHHGLADRLGSSLRHHAAALRGDTARIADRSPASPPGQRPAAARAVLVPFGQLVDTAAGDQPSALEHRPGVCVLRRHNPARPHARAGAARPAFQSKKKQHAARALTKLCDR